MKYLMIFEDNSVWATDSLTEDDKLNSMDGILTIINLEDLTIYVEDNVWVPVEQK